MLPGNSRGGTFRSIKFAKSDTIGRNLLLREEIRAKVYFRPYMCTDMWDSSAGSEEKGFEIGGVATVGWTEAWGGMLRGFEDVRLLRAFFLPSVADVVLFPDVLRRRRTCRRDVKSSKQTLASPVI